MLQLRASGFGFCFETPYIFDLISGLWPWIMTYLKNVSLNIYYHHLQLCSSIQIQPAYYILHCDHDICLHLHTCYTYSDLYYVFCNIFWEFRKKKNLLPDNNCLENIILCWIQNARLLNCVNHKSYCFAMQNFVRYNFQLVNSAASKKYEKLDP